MVSGVSTIILRSPFACRRAHGPWGGSYLEALSLAMVDRCSHGFAIVPSSISWYFGERMRSAGLTYIVTDSISTSLLRQQLRWMREAAFDVTVISAPGERLIRCAEEEGVRAVAVPMARPIRLWQDLRSLLDLIVALRRLRPQVVNAGTPKAALLGMLASFVLRVPVRI